jgi:hypothetical protein
MNCLGQLLNATSWVWFQVQRKKFASEGMAGERLRLAAGGQFTFCRQHELSIAAAFLRQK